MGIISITGASGFVGKNLIEYLHRNSNHSCFGVNLRTNFSQIQFNESDAIVHLAGKAHDLKKVNNKDEYYQVNTELTQQIFDYFIKSNANVFLLMSSVKAAADRVDGILTENDEPNPKTHYGKSKLLAEKYILEQPLPPGKKVFILRPCMIHGPGNKGNLNLLYKFVKRRIPWPLGSYQNKRSFLSIENLCFVIQNLIEDQSIPSGIYQVADDEPLSTNELIGIISKVNGYKSKIWFIPKILIQGAAKVGNILRLPLNHDRLQKLTESYIVSNKKLLSVLEKPLPVNSSEGLTKTIRSFNYD